MIEIANLTKRYGDKVAVENLSFEVPPGKVTGFLGPNGAGKSTTIRLILGLDRPTAGRIAVNGKSFTRARRPMRAVGALIDAGAVHGGRTVKSHLLCLAQSNGLPSRRVADVLDMVGLAKVGKKRCKGLSLGMRQRLGIAGALLGDPGILIFDEPANGLDPEGIVWMRNLMRRLASEGRTVLVSSHLMSEMQNTADHLIVIGRGRLIADQSLPDFIRGSGALTVRVRSPQADELGKAVTEAGGRLASTEGDVLVIHGMSAERVGDLAFAHRTRVHELIPVHHSLEDAYMKVTADAVEFTTGQTGQDGAEMSAAAEGR
jgi:ABC-2 type transport system ATP-binding protein